MPFNDSIPLFLPSVYFIRVRTTYTAEKAAKYRFGLSISGRAKLSIDGKLAIDQWTSLPEKTDDTPVFNSFTMESLADLDAKAGQKYEIEVLLTNDAIDTTIVGAAPAAGLRIGMYEVIDEDSSIAEAVELAKRVDVPIVLTGLSSDYEYENKDRKDLVLPGRINELISRVLEANPKTVSLLPCLLLAYNGRKDILTECPLSRLLSPSPACPSGCPGYTKQAPSSTPGLEAKKSATASQTSYSAQ